jgi:superfamily II RNA helicase
MPESPAIRYNFPLDPFQQHAVSAIHRGENVLVTAKTGSGKTLVGEYQIAHSLAQGKRVFYTTPIKSLSNQKYYDLKQMFPSVGIMTGDLKFRPDADVVIMTTEILRNLLFKQNSSTKSLGITANLSLDRLGAVVFDECHYVNDPDRGAVWEETMILLPPEVNLVLLSATIDGPELFASWLGELKQVQIHLLSTEYRIVPLLHGVYKGDELQTILDSKDHFQGGSYKGWLQWREGQKKAGEDHTARVADRRRGGYEDGPVARGPGGSAKSYIYQLNTLIGRLETQGLLPALTFVFSRKDCERYAAKIEHTLLDSSDAASVRHILDFHLHRYGEGLQRMPQYHTLRSLLEKGIGFHHSGLLPVLKEAVEILFGKGFVKLLFATETFAVGINMPTKTVIFTGYRKYDDATEGMRILRTDEYIQMAGRAGRRGKDDKGLVLYLPDREPEGLEEVRKMMTGARPTFQSRMTFHYDFLLKTMQSGNLKWRQILRQSYWYQKYEQGLALARQELIAAEAAVEALGLQEAEREAMEEWEVLTTRLKQSVNAAKKEAQRLMGAWEKIRTGPRWYAVQKELWPKWKSLQREIESLHTESDEPNREIGPWLTALAAMGFVEEGTEDVLTPLGVSATEVNEGHPILLPLLYKEQGDIMKHLSAEEIVTALSAFLGEGASSSAHPDTLKIPAQVRDTLWEIDTHAKRCQKLENGCSAARAPKDTYWDLNATWVEPIWRWLCGVPATQLCEEYGFYEGNLMRMLLKLVNILEEWRSLATLASDTEMLEKLVGIEDKLLCDVAICDSLYLRL